jgi:hypothetical protein
MRQANMIVKLQDAIEPQVIRTMREQNKILERAMNPFGCH